MAVAIYWGEPLSHTLSGCSWCKSQRVHAALGHLFLFLFLFYKLIAFLFCFCCYKANGGCLTGWFLLFFFFCFSLLLSLLFCPGWLLQWHCCDIRSTRRCCQDTGREEVELGGQDTCIQVDYYFLFLFSNGFFFFCTSSFAQQASGCIGTTGIIVVGTPETPGWKHQEAASGRILRQGSFFHLTGSFLCLYLGSCTGELLFLFPFLVSHSFL